MLAAFLSAALVAAQPPSTKYNGCGGHWRVSLNRESFANNGAGRQFSEADLSILSARMTIALMVAARDACDGGKLKRSRAKAVQRVDVVSASGATEPHIFSAGRGTLRFEWTFAEEGLAVPSRATMVGALACWADPSEPACAAEGD